MHPLFFHSLVPIVLALFLGFAIAFIFLSNKKKKEEKQLQIEGPRNVRHESHIGFNSGILVVRNLPPEYQVLFDNINQNLEVMGVPSLTEKETKLILKALPILGTSQLAPSKRLSQTSAIKEVANTEEIATLQTQIRALNLKLMESENLVKKLQREMEFNQTKLGSEPQSSTKGNEGLKEGTEGSSSNTNELEIQNKKLLKEISELEEENLKLKIQLESSSHATSRTSHVEADEGSTLTSIPIPIPSPPPPPPPSSTDQEKPKLVLRKNGPNSLEKNQQRDSLSEARMELLQAIRDPHKLKHVTEVKKQKKDLLEDKSVGAIIARALVKRRQVIKVEAPETEETDDLDKWI